MKYKNKKYRFHADGSFDEKKEPSRRALHHRPAPRKEERAPRGEYLSFLLALRQGLPKKAGGVTFTWLKKVSRIKNDRAAMRLIDRAVRDGVLERGEGLFFLTAAGRKKIALLENSAAERSAEEKALSAAGNAEKLPRGFERAEMLRFKGTFGFARAGEGERARDVFIPGSKLGSALPGDTVLLRVHKGVPGQLDDGEVVRVLKEGNTLFTGVAHVSTRPAPRGAHGSRAGSRLRRVTADLPELGAEVTLLNADAVQDGERVTFRLRRGGNKGHENRTGYRGELVARFGDAAKAANTAEALLAAAGIKRDFPPEALGEGEWYARLGVRPGEIEGRADFREHPIFTIDSAESKDLDDAVEVSFDGKEWTLGVHIADVSHYVRPGSPLDDEAMNRGTSIYYADRVVPMLPPALSNGICSLNPGEDRLAFSCIMTLDKNGNLLDFDFKKSVIRSRVKGVYSEINRLLAGEEDPALAEKYAAVSAQLPLMEKLYTLRRALREARGVPEIESSECKLILDGDGTCVDVALRERGKAEEMIEEFMLLANESAARLGKMLELPFVYRVHEKPSAEKIESLSTLLLSLGETGVRENPPAGELSALLNRVKGKSYETLVNRQVLRSMAKAAYDEKPLGHYGLVLEDYAHFTSPIRRYPDLSIHRILSLVVSMAKTGADGRLFLPDKDRKKIETGYRAFVRESARLSSEAEVRAMRVERECEDSYKAEYMTRHIGEVYPCIISGVTAYGLYLETEKGIEGLVRIEWLPGGEYTLDGASLKESFSGKGYRVGDRVEAKVMRADAAEGEIDFSLIE